MIGAHTIAKLDTTLLYQVKRNRKRTQTVQVYAPTLRCL